MIRSVVAALAALTASLGANAVLAEEPLALPRYDAAFYCAIASSANGGETNCRRREDQLRARLAENWDALPFQKRHFCVTSVRFLRKELRSYDALNQCLGAQGIS